MPLSAETTRATVGARGARFLRGALTAAWAMIFCVIFWGCGSAEQSPSSATGTSRAEQGDPPSPSAEAPVSTEIAHDFPSTAGNQAAPSVRVEVVDENQFAEALARYKGQVVLVDYWATWCPSCLELFPHTVELSRKMRDKGVAVVSVSLDDPEDTDLVLKKLKEMGADFENFLCSYGASAKAVDAFDITDGALPHYKVFDREGKLRKTLASSAGPITPQLIEKAVEEVLAE